MKLKLPICFSSCHNYRVSNLTQPGAQEQPLNTVRIISLIQAAHGPGTTLYPAYSRVLKLLCIQFTPRFWNYFVSILLQDHETTLNSSYSKAWNYSVFALLQGQATITLCPIYSKVLKLLCIHLTPSGLCNFLCPSYSRALKLPSIQLIPGSWNYLHPIYSKVLKLLCIHLTPLGLCNSLSPSYSSTLKLLCIFILLQDPKTTLYSSYSRTLKLLCIHLTPGSWNYPVFILLQGLGTTLRQTYFELHGSCIFSVFSICIPGIICIHLTPGSWNYFVSNLLRFPRVLYFLCIQYLYSGIICIYLTGVLNITLYNIKSGVLKK